MQDFPFNSAAIWPFLIPIVAIIGGITVAIVSTMLGCCRWRFESASP
jgi:hypothetical protein